MTRKTSTESEIVTGNALMDYLRAKEIVVNLIPREINDKPDLFFQADSDQIGCECVQIPPGRVFKYVHSRFKQLEKSDSAAVRVIWPQEQHFWVKEAIESKTNKIGTYKRNCDAKKIWLLIHAPVSEKDTTVHYEKDEIVKLMKYAAKKTPHNFDRIYFWGPKVGIKKIYPVASGWKNVTFNFEGGYPTDEFVMAKAKITTTEEGAEPILYDYGQVTPDEIIVPPSDPEFKKHEPRYTKRKYHLKILVGANYAQPSFEPVDEKP